MKIWQLHIIDDKVLALSKKLMEKDLKFGWEINPDNDYVRGVIRGLIRREGHCLSQAPQEENTICPCKNYRDNRECKCKLYLRKGEY